MTKAAAATGAKDPPGEQPAPAPTHYAVTPDAMIATLRYLASRPYSEVHELIQTLQASQGVTLP